MPREFVSSPAVRRAVPLLIGLVGPSGTGKTVTALRLATGMQRVARKRIFVVDSEHGRSTLYAPKPGQAPNPPDTFDFTHVPFSAPFSPNDYRTVGEYCQRQGAGIVIFDSVSHEHEGAGGLLDMHESELDRMSKGDWQARERMKMAAWIKPKAAHTAFLGWVLQSGLDVIMCFRAKEKLRIVKGREPEKRGWQPIGSPDLVYEMTLNILLLPGQRGAPVLQPEQRDEKAMVKIPGHVASLFNASRQINEDTGQALAEWAAGSAAPTFALADLYAALEGCATRDELDTLTEHARKHRASMSTAEKTAIKAALDMAAARVASAQQVKPPADDAREGME